MFKKNNLKIKNKKMHLKGGGGGGGLGYPVWGFRIEKKISRF